MILKLFKITQSKVDSFTRRVLTMYNGNVNTVTGVQYGPYGEDSNPVKNSVGIYAPTELDGKEVCLGIMNKNAKSELGERRIFATDENGNFMFNMWLRADGTVLIGSSEVPAEYTNFAVKFNELKNGFDALKADFNALVTAYNAHTHPIINAIPAATPPGVVTSSVTTSTGTPSAATIDPSKNEKIKLKNE